MTVVSQWAATDSATAGINIIANNKLCSGSSDTVLAGSKYRSSTTCVFKIDANVNPIVYLQIICTGASYMNIDTPTDTAVTYVTM